MDRLEEYNIECMLINDNQAQEDELIKEYEKNSMNRLISEQAVIESIEFFQMNPQHFDFVNLIDDIKEIPSAEPYKGMTNGEVIKEVFPYVEVKDNCKEFYSVNIENLPRDRSFNTIGFTKDWWNSPYEPQERE